MKELYISPELEILSFLPTQGIAATWGMRSTGHDDGVSTGEIDPSYDYRDPVRDDEEAPL